MKTFLIRFKVIDHYSEVCSPEEQTCIVASDLKSALDIFYNDLSGECVIVETAEEAKWI